MIASAIAVAFVIGMMTSPSAVSAHLDICSQPSVDSSKSVWHGLCDLQQQIDTIELTPGPQGPAGSTQSLTMTIKTASISIPASGQINQFLICDAGQLATDAGYSVNRDVEVLSLLPSFGNTGFYFKS